MNALPLPGHRVLITRDLRHPGGSGIVLGTRPGLHGPLTQVRLDSGRELLVPASACRPG